jgi:hypothetical protein
MRMALEFTAQMIILRQHHGMTNINIQGAVL